MLDRKNILTVILLLFFMGCTTSLKDLNKMTRDAFAVRNELNRQASELDSKFIGVDRETIRDFFGKPKRISYEPYPYSLDRDCRGKGCEGDVSDEIWFYDFKKKFSSGWEAYTLYVYFKNDKVVRIR